MLMFDNVGGCTDRWPSPSQSELRHAALDDMFGQVSQVNPS
jgi:hypothetical protein